MTTDVLAYLQTRVSGTLRRAGGDEVHIPCFFHGEDPQDRGRLYVNVDPSAEIPGLHLCHVCGAKGSLVSIKRFFGDKDELPVDDHSQERYEILQNAAAYYHEALADNEEAFSWLRRVRGLSVETIVEQKIGWAAGNTLFQHLRQAGCDTKVILETGLVIDRGGRMVDALIDMVTIPYYVAGNVVLIRGRTFPYKGDGYSEFIDGPKYKTPSNQATRLFNSQAAWGAEEIVVCEGEFDALVCKQLGFNAVGVPGANTWQDSWDGYLAGAKRVHLVFDNDEAGIKGADKLAEKFGSKIRRVEMPAAGPGEKKNDPTEWIVGKGHTLEDFQALLDAADQGGLLLTPGQAREEFLSVQGVSGLKFGIELLDLMIEPGLLPAQVMVVLAKAGSGKGHALWQELPTPSGMRRMGDLAIGDEVTGSDGRPTKVLGVYDRGVLPTYRVTFSDGASVEVDGDHLWNVRYRYGRQRRWDGEKTISTAELAAGSLRAGFQDGEWRYTIPMCAPVEHPHRGLPVDPYTLGALLANGSLNGSSAVLTTPDAAVVARVAQAYEVHRIAPRPGDCPRYVVRGAIGQVRRLGAAHKSGAKFIPEPYLMASVEQRVALLQGLMDGDGSGASAHHRRSVQYFTSSSRLADDVVRLVTSLGGTATQTWSQRPDVAPECQMSIMLPDSIAAFGTGRKNTKAGPLTRVPMRAIVSIEPVEAQEIRCIAVDAPDSLYLVGREHLVTHNTLFLLNAMERMTHVKGQEKLNFLFISLEQTRGEWFDRARRIHRFYNLNKSDDDVERFWATRIRLTDKNRMSEDELNTVLDDYVFQMGRKPDLVCIDYIGYWAQGFKGDRYERVSDAIMSLKAVAKEWFIPVIAPHQVSRSTRYGEEPDADAARDAGVIEETADFLLVLWTQDHILGRAEDEKTGIVSCRIGKSRHGGRGTKIDFQFAPVSLTLVPIGDQRWVGQAREELHYERLTDNWDAVLRRHRGELPQGSLATRLPPHEQTEMHI